MSKTSVACAAMTFAGALVLSGAAAADPEAVRVARYSQLVGADRTERDPLAIVAALRFPREIVVTVGDGLRYLLQRTGYSVVAGDTDSEHLLALPLPESHRQLGPHRVHALAQILVGDAFVVCASARQRIVTVRAPDEASRTPSCESSQ